MSFGEYLEGIGRGLELPETKEARENWVAAVDKEPTYFGKIAAGVTGVLENPLVLTEVAKEIGQEVAPAALGLKVVKYAGLAAGAVASTVTNAIESAGSASRSTYDEAIAQGKSKEDAIAEANKNGAIEKRILKE